LPICACSSSCTPTAAPRNPNEIPNPRSHASPPRLQYPHSARYPHSTPSPRADVRQSRCRCARDLGFLQALPLARQHVGEDVRHLVRRDAPCLGRRCSAAQQWALRRAIAAVATAETTQRSRAAAD
jgi:hypothetical protein